jgi:hypothetical protein
MFPISLGEPRAILLDSSGKLLQNPFITFSKMPKIKKQLEEKTNKPKRQF